MRHLFDKFFIKQPRFRRFVTRLLEGEKELRVQMLGANLQLHSVKEHGYLRASRLISRSSLLSDELPILMDLASLLKPGDTFVDVGANVGVFSLSLARLRPLLGEVFFYAFEANPDTFRRLKVSADEQGIQAWNRAISNREGELQFVAGAVSHVFTTVDNLNSYSIRGDLVTVPCQRLDTQAIQGDSIIIKIDVEGHEQEVLEGCEGLFAAGRIKAVYLDGYKSESIPTFLKNKGFRLLDGRTLQPVSGQVFSLLAVNS